LAAGLIAEDLARASHRGCPFINSIAELPDASHPARILVAAHKARQLARLEKLCGEAGVAHPAAAAVHLSCVLEGAGHGAEWFGAEYRHAHAGDGARHTQDLIGSIVG